MTSIDWHYCQHNSDTILGAGLQRLSSSNFITLDQSVPDKAGNYLISFFNRHYYIGEAKQLRKRLSQQFRAVTSTFYKTYLPLSKKLSPDREIGIHEFLVQVESTNIGRKELEECGIVNFPTLLNKFQLAKRKRLTGNFQEEIWDQVQNQAPLILENGEKELLNSRSSLWSTVDIPNNPGLYAIEDHNGKLIYIGESSDFITRYKTHSGNTYFSALRRNLGTDIFGFSLIERNGKKRYFETKQDKVITEYLSNCQIKFVVIEFGRFELEEYLIRKYNPLLNRKDNSSP
jgi:predicted GIY-YIG superfamily endonuclease